MLKHMGAVELPKSDKKEEDKNEKVNPFKNSELPMRLHPKHVTSIFK